MNANTIAIVISIFSIWSLSACCDYKCKLKEKPPVKTEEEAVGANTFSLEGTARNAALGAVIVMDKGTPIYIEGLAEWPADFLGKRVKAKGILRQKKLAPDPMVDDKGGVSHGMQGLADVLEKAEWTIVETPAQ